MNPLTKDTKLSRDALFSYGIISNLIIHLLGFTLFSKIFNTLKLVCDLISMTILFYIIVKTFICSGKDLGLVWLFLIYNLLIC